MNDTIPGLIVSLQLSFLLSSGMAGRFRDCDGDWICPDLECGNLNFARRTVCNRCGKEQTENSAQKKQIGVEIGKAAAKKSRGLFSAEDWQCTMCDNINWLRRQQCNVCNAPKFGEMEERTGYGGGYYDRGVVEYVEREESDDEYDEFGRKKKKFRKTTSPEEGGKESSNHTKPLSPIDDGKQSCVDEDYNEDEDDEDEDGDLSKYDLSGWVQDGEDKDKTVTSNEKLEVDSNPNSNCPDSSSGSSHSRSPSRNCSRGRRRFSCDSKSRSRSRSGGTGRSKSPGETQK